MICGCKKPARNPQRVCTFRFPSLPNAAFRLHSLLSDILASPPRSVDLFETNPLASGTQKLIWGPLRPASHFSPSCSDGKASQNAYALLPYTFSVSLWQCSLTKKPSVPELGLSNPHCATEAAFAASKNCLRFSEVV